MARRERGRIREMDLRAFRSTSHIIRLDEQRARARAVIGAAGRVQRVSSAGSAVAGASPGDGAGMRFSKSIQIRLSVRQS